MTDSERTFFVLVGVSLIASAIAAGAYALLGWLAAIIVMAIVVGFVLILFGISN